MAVTVDAAANSGAPAVGQPANYTHTISSSSNLILVYAAQTSAAANTVSTVAVGGIAATFRGRSVAVVGNEIVELWSLANPPTGAQTIAVVWTAAPNNSTTASISFLGSDGTIGAPVTGNGTVSPATITVASATGNLVSDGLIQDSGVDCLTDTGTPDATQTQRWSVCTDAIFSHRGSTKPGAASVVMSWTLASTTSWSMIGVDVHAGAGALFMGWQMPWPDAVSDKIGIVAVN